MTNPTPEQAALHTMTEEFLRWPLPESVCADYCAMKQGTGRVGTNLLSYSEAKQMLQDIVAPELTRLQAALAEKETELGYLHGKLGLFAKEHFGISDNLSSDETLRNMAVECMMLKKARRASEQIDTDLVAFLHRVQDGEMTCIKAAQYIDAKILEGEKLTRVKVTQWIRDQYKAQQGAGPGLSIVEGWHIGLDRIDELKQQLAASQQRVAEQSEIISAYIGTADALAKTEADRDRMKAALDWRGSFGIVVGNLDSIAWRLEQGKDNGAITREALAVFLRSVGQRLTQSKAALATPAAQAATEETLPANEQ